MTDNRTLDISTLILRLAFGGFMILNHGLRKLDKLLAGPPIKFADPFGLGAELSLQLAVLGEVICPIFIILGLFTRIAAVRFSRPQVAAVGAHAPLTSRV